MSIFSQIKKPKIKSSVFNLSQERKLDCNFGELVPIMCQEVLPHDKFKVSTELLIKLVPLKSPMMHRVQATVHYFFVPTFQINSVFEKFINPKVNTDNSIVNPFVYPKSISTYGKVTGRSDLLYSLADYLGLPVLNSGWLALDSSVNLKSCVVNIDPFRAYQHIYNSFYRDQNCEVLEDASPATTSLFLISNYLGLSGGVQTGTTPGYLPANQQLNLFKLRTRAWAKDYFTSALPSPQAGDDVLIPMQSVVQDDGAMKFEGFNSTEEGGFNDGPVLLSSENDDDAADDIGSLYAEDSTGNNNRLRYSSGLKVTNIISCIIIIFRR